MYYIRNTTETKTNRILSLGNLDGKNGGFNNQFTKENYSVCVALSKLNLCTVKILQANCKKMKIRIVCHFNFCQMSNQLFS